jgi:uncharacterized membrane protein
MIRRLAVLAATIALGVVPMLPASARQDDTAYPSVRAVLFFSPTCPHCHQVINEDLPGVFARFGGEPTLYFDEGRPPEEVAFYRWTNATIDLLVVDVSLEAGAALYSEDTVRLGVPENRRGVPRLSVGDEYLVGSREIPEEFPRIVEESLPGGGIGWPPIAGIEEALAEVPTPVEATTTTAPTTTTGGAATTPAGGTVPATTVAEPNPGSTVPDGSGALPVGLDSIADRVGRDPLANGIAIAVLAAMVASLVAVPLLVRRGSLGAGPTWAVPVLGIAGLGVSIYLASVEAGGGEAVCGPVGDCNAVQQSEYAELFGIPIGVIGIVGYAIVLGAWTLGRLRTGRLADWAEVTVLAIGSAGTVFSVYLTFLEPFVIGATCAWCLSSAVAVTLLLWLSAGRGWAALGRLRTR